MATFEEKWTEFKNYLTERVPDWNSKFLDWANARGFGYNGGFFNEFPHTHTYETDLSWLISRMKWVLFRMDSVEERMKAVEELLTDFIDSMNIPQLIKDEIHAQMQELIDNGTFENILRELTEDCVRYSFISSTDSLLSGIKIGDLYGETTDIQLANPNDNADIAVINGQLYLGSNMASNSGGFPGNPVFTAQQAIYNPGIVINFAEINNRLSEIGLQTNVLYNQNQSTSSTAYCLTALCRNYSHTTNKIYLTIWRNSAPDKIRLNSNFDLSGATSAYELLKQGDNRLHFINFAIPLAII